MDNFKVFVIMDMLLSPVVVTFGWGFFRGVLRFNKRHHIVSFSSGDEFIMDDMSVDDDEVMDEVQARLRKTDCKNEPLYVDELYC